MCCFSRPVEFVNATRIFARAENAHRQFVVYAMTMSAKEDLAMILPLPVRAGYVTLSQSGTNVLKTCNPSNSASNSACRVTSLPGESGYQLVASRSAPIIINGVTVGTQYEKVWRHCTDTTAYIFGTRVQMNAEVWDGTGLAFNVNDLLRQVRSDQSVAVAYYAGSPVATKLLSYAGRTSTGLNEYDTAQPPRENGWVDFRIDANAADPDGQSSPYSPWLLVKTRAPEGYALQSFADRKSTRLNSSHIPLSRMPSSA